MNEYGIVAAFIVGLMGAAHCVGMCSGLVGALSNPTSGNLKLSGHNTRSALPRKMQRSPFAHQLTFVLSYNLGRISSYTLAGALVGGSVSGLGLLFNMDAYLLFLRAIAGLMMIATGLYIAQVWAGVMQIEYVGKIVWRFVAPLANKFIPVKTPFQAMIAGLLWGWLPCGLVYSTLTWSVAANSALEGGLIMLAFGLGTLPALLSMGMAATQLSYWVQKKTIRILSGMILIAFGIQTLYIAIAQYKL
ncbi:sulfite exporter TauE/SafE family protein [Shewanella surugensis]|uniref:Sulfite exporter TauE/SafE family protein n=1 Tax=Shewanella surugensis TaxID=212020 RepID=A0ABT0LF79_9GAMM|nr:sulfite exporter TauE/SafE family protein [Shewanella surugensis]MCL1125982.1 sulfite exporter TauE/SafE family protein [Shewanella surugensis]